jgi:hypothetical protein
MRGGGGLGRENRYLGLGEKMQRHERRSLRQKRAGGLVLKGFMQNP